MIKPGYKYRYDFYAGMQKWTVPADIYRVKFEVYGGQGGTFTSHTGGLGGYAYGELNVTEGQIFYIYTGGMGKQPTGGYNGGGRGGGSDTSTNTVTGGGGGTDVRLGSVDIANRIIVAGGGGGGNYNNLGGDGGGLTGLSGLGSKAGTGGTQTTGGVNTNNSSLNGTLGDGGKGNAGSQNYSGGGGGGGYYGGAGGHYGIKGVASSGAGGSSYVGMLENAGTTAGVNEGDGYVEITVVESKYNEVVPHSDLTNVSDRANIFEYSVNTNTPTIDVIEKVDGVEVARKTLKRGEITSVSTNEEYWNSLAYGSYRSNTGAVHTIGIIADSFTYAYPFTKTLHNNSSLEEITKSIEDNNNSVLPSIKTKLATKSEVTNEATFEDLIAGITLEKMGGRNFASGSITSTASNTVVIRGLSFSPLMIIIRPISESSLGSNFNIHVDKSLLVNANSPITSSVSGSSTPGVVPFTTFSDGFSMNARSTNTVHSWIAIG